MKEVSVKDFGKTVSKWLEVAKYEEVVITKRGSKAFVLKRHEVLTSGEEASEKVLTSKEEVGKGTDFGGPERQVHRFQGIASDKAEAV